MKNDRRSPFSPPLLPSSNTRQSTHLRLFPDLLVAGRRGAVERVHAHGLGLAVEELVNALLERAHPGDHDADEHEGERQFRGHFCRGFKGALLLSRTGSARVRSRGHLWVGRRRREKGVEDEKHARARLKKRKVIFVFFFDLLYLEKNIPLFFFFFFSLLLTRTRAGTRNETPLIPRYGRCHCSHQLTFFPCLSSPIRERDMPTVCVPEFLRAAVSLTTERGRKRGKRCFRFPFLRPPACCCPHAQAIVFSHLWNVYLFSSIRFTKNEDNSKRAAAPFFFFL